MSIKPITHEQSSTIKQELLPIVAQIKVRMGLKEIPNKFFDAEVLPGDTNRTNVQVKVNEHKVQEYIFDLRSEIKRYEELLEKAKQFNYLNTK